MREPKRGCVALDRTLPDRERMAPDLEPRTVGDLVLTVDLAPTLAALLDVPVPEELDGVARSL